MQEAPPCRQSSILGALSVDVVPVKLSSATVNVHLGRAEPALALPQVTTNPEEQYDKGGKVGVEELLSSTRVADSTDRGNGGIELGQLVAISWSEHGVDENVTYLSNEDNDDDTNTQPGTVDTTNGLEGNLIQRMPVELPRGTEPDVGNADGRP